MRADSASLSGPGAGAGDGREILPTNVKPIHYKLVFEPDLKDAIEFQGSVVIDLKVVDYSSSISLNASELEILETEVLTGDGEQFGIKSAQFDKSKDVVTFELEKSLRAGSKAQLKIKFTGRHDHRAVGWFRSPVKGAEGDNWMVSTFMEPVDARKVFPAFDEPALKATFDVTVIADKRFTCLGNMDVASIVPHGEHKQAVTFNTTPLMSTYIVCLAVGKFNMIETDSFRVPVRVYCAEDQNAEQGRFALNLAARTLAAFEKIFDIDFPLPKMDLIAVPSGSGAMENWGLVTFSDFLLLVDEDKTSAKALRQTGSVVVHELAHQWFGNIVTMDFWEGLWLNEGFADWAELHAWETLEPAWKMWENYAVGGYQRGLLLDSNKASHPIEVPVKRANEIKQIFDDISYAKGCAVIRMISNFLGVEVFVKGMQLYLKKHAYGNATTNDLWNSLSEVSGKDIGAIMEKWTKNIGYPVVDVLEDPTTGTITVTQHRFLQDGSSSPEDDQLLYPLSLGVRTSRGVVEETLYSRSRELLVPFEFYKLNANHNGFYRVSYPRTRREILRRNVEDGLLAAEDKIGLISDTLAMAYSGHGTTRTSDVLELLKIFENEPSYSVWVQIFTAIRSIEKVFMFEDSSLSAALKTFQARLMGKTLRQKGWDFQKSDDPLEQMFKAIMFAHGKEDPKVRRAAKDMFADFAGGDSQAININIQRPVFAIALEQGDAKEYEVILKTLSQATTLEQRNVCLNTFGHAQDAELIQRTLNFAVSPAILARNDSTKILNTLGEHRAGAEAIWSWMKENWDGFPKTIASGMVAYKRLLVAGTGSLSTKEQWNDVREFFEGKITQAYDTFLAQSLDTIKTKANWVERDREDVRQWLNDRGYAGENRGE